MGKIEGTITDADNNLPLTGASVLVSNYKGDNTDAFGKFSISGIQPGLYELVISHISYKTELIRVEVKENLVSAVTAALKKTNLDLAEIKINGRRNLLHTTLGQVDIQLRPVNTSQDILRIVPGLFIAQHAGGGKAEQIFLRGFDIDHGTDIQLSVDGMPVNMPSHAHGQGYADLHFLIPELVEKVNFDMGPYSPNKGNLATAGYVEFNTKDFLKDNSLKLEAGRFHTNRITGLVKLFHKETPHKRQQVFIASEYMNTDGYVESPQDFHRFNLMGKYNAWLSNQQQISISASTFDSKWNASGQIPQRAVQAGIISRFGSIDNSEGGNTRRTNFNFRLTKQGKNNWQTANQFYYSRYHFNLFSNFTFFLKDTINGDQINQHENRSIIGYNNTATKTWLLGGKPATTAFGAGFRYDNIKDLTLTKAVKRQFLSSLQSGDVKESNGFFFWNQEAELTDKLSLTGGFRVDFFRFAYRNRLAGDRSFRKQTRSIISPKLTVSYSFSPVVKVFLKNGIGFHSNDTRVILDNSAKDILPRVAGTDLGIIWKPVKKLILKTVFWHFYSAQEFVYVGDEGIIEPGGKTRRMGIDVSARYQFSSWLFGDLDVNITKARKIGSAKGENFVPLAPSFTSIGGLSAKMKNGLHGSIRYRFMDKRPANEWNTVKTQGYFIADIIMAYPFKKMELSVSAENIFNTEWREAQFDTESRLKNETMPVSEIHFTPGTPRFIKAGITFRF
jgi:hypothetical protein